MGYGIKKRCCVIFCIFLYQTSFGILQIAMASTTFGRARDRMQLSTTICDRALKLVHKKMTHASLQTIRSISKGCVFLGSARPGGSNVWSLPLFVGCSSLIPK